MASVRKLFDDEPAPSAQAARRTASSRERVEEVPSDGEIELVDFPAAVVCATCGAGDCPGCLDERVTGHSGVVVFVPWERAGGVFGRFWATTRASTDGAEAFFLGLPDGPVGTALSYALVAELSAVGSSLALCFALGVGMLWALFPAWAAYLLTGPATQLALARVFVVMVATFTALLVAAHALHGFELDRAAAKVGGKRMTSRALRFGLYAAGWDVVTSPVGVAVTLLTAGPRAVFALREHAFRTPGRATAAMLRGLYKIDGEQAGVVRAGAMRTTMTASVVFIIVALALSAASARG